MIKSVIKLGLFLVVGILVYNFFLGTPEEKAQSKQIFGKAVEVGKAGVGLIKDEVEKFKSGKYDDALDKVGGLLSKAKEKGGDLAKRIEGWEADRKTWQEKKDQLKDMFDNASEEEKEEIGQQIKELNEEGELLEANGKKLNEEAQE